MLSFAAPHAADAPVHDSLALLDELVHRLALSVDPDLKCCQSSDLDRAGETEPSRADAE